MKLHAQDPHFTQAYATPLLVNPAYTGVFDNAEMRFSASHRQQWSNLGTPFTTSFFGFDTKLFDKNNNYQNPFNLGINLLSDKTFGGALKSNTATIDLSYHVSLKSDGLHTLGIGMGIGYGTKRFDFSALSTSSQFTNGGFDLTIPNGEIPPSIQKPYLLISPGILYTYNNIADGTFIDFGLAVFNSNKPTISFFNDQNQKIPRKLSANISLQKYINNSYLLNVDLQYQLQSSVDYLLSGISVAKLMSEDIDPSMLGFGLWYRTNDIIAPYLFTELNRFRFGFSYDLQINGISTSKFPSSTLEFSVIWRYNKKNKKYNS